MKILLFSDFYLPGFKGGGPIKTIANLIGTTSDRISYNIVTSDRDLGDNKPYSTVIVGQWNSLENGTVFYADRGLKGLKQIANAIFKKDYDVIYLNSFFSVRFSLIPLLLAKLVGKSIVLAPRGEFSAGALSQKRFKKKVFIGCYRFFKFSAKPIFQASTDFEENDIKKILGNNINIVIAGNIASQYYTNNLVPKKNNILNVVFLSRITPMKNLTYALNVFSKVTYPVVFDIYGPIEDKSYWEQCEIIINRLPENIKANYKSLVNPSNVITTLAAYDLFFMPTKGENYSHVIAEALCSGLPILIANTTPWKDLQTKGIGWDLPLDNINAFSEAIDKLAIMNPDDHYEMRLNVLKWSKNKFSQKDTIDANIAMFKYAANK